MSQLPVNPALQSLLNLPWQTFEDRGEPNISLISTCDKRVVALIRHNGEYSTPQQMANTNLIAYTPHILSLAESVASDAGRITMATQRQAQEIVRYICAQGPELHFEPCSGPWQQGNYPAWSEQPATERRIVYTKNGRKDWLMSVDHNCKLSPTEIDALNQLFCAGPDLYSLAQQIATASLNLPDPALAEEAQRVLCLATQNDNANELPACITPKATARPRP